MPGSQAETGARRQTSSWPDLADLSRRQEFIARHIGPDEAQQGEMLSALGLNSMDELIEQVVPPSILYQQGLDIGGSHSEEQALDRLRRIAWKNKLFRSFIGQGYYNVVTPRIILRSLLENPGWYTAYTPYQAEISQGRLEALLNYQTMVSDLTGMDLANASLLDEGTAAAEAMMLCKRVTKSKSNVFLIAPDCLPQTIAVMRTRAHYLGIEIKLLDSLQDLDQRDYFGVLLQYPGVSGEVHDYTEIIGQAHGSGAMAVVAADILALLLLKPPASLGADIAVGCTQRFGVSLSFGGPHAAYMAVREVLKRSLPGRLVGVSIDNQGNPAYRLALQTREQHIRREKATSNICTSQALLAMIASMYAVYHGPEGLRRIAERVHILTVLLAQGLKELGYEVINKNFFDTLTINSGNKTSAIHSAARTQKINLREINDHQIGLSLDESVIPEDIDILLDIFALGRTVKVDIAGLEQRAQQYLDADLLRTDAVLTHPSFNSYHTETEMMRYLRRLVNKDIALDRSMIPLGSCTMKLNAASEIIPVTWGAFARIHPLAPLDQAKGYLQVIEELEQMLCVMTGYDTVSLQPNAGSQGEFAGLLAIKKYHESRGDGRRDTCLIPGSAHGTNPASAMMCGMRVVVVGCDPEGNVDAEDLRAKAEKYSDVLAAIMITYPSTHGVFEEQIREICEIVHQHGGQVYIDGANLNAMVGLCCPGKFGGDVSHFNLHKTFCIPHGGGGPGVGPVGVRAHLAPFLPGHDVLDRNAKGNALGAVSSAPWGSAGILPITWMYLRMMGAPGMAQATRVAILNANYITERLSPHYEILYTGKNNRVAHECIIDLRPLKQSSGVDPEDVAKRLIDFGFHAPTMSFPVLNTLMIEPTESESKVELDRFCEAMICIRKEIADVEQGQMDKQDNPLKNAPHTAEMIAADVWEHAYSREQAAYPVGRLRHNKYWVPVSRIDNMHGDRNLICACPRVEEYAEEHD